MTTYRTRRWTAVFSAILATALVIGSAPAASAMSGPIGVWRLQGNFKNSKSTNVKLRKVGEPVFNKLLVRSKKKKALVFDEGEGLKIRNIPKKARKNYTIDILLEFDAVDSYRRIMSFGPNDVDLGGSTSTTPPSVFTTRRNLRAWSSSRMTGYVFA